MTSDLRLDIEFADNPGEKPELPEDVTDAKLSIAVPGDILTLNRKAGRSRLVSETSDTVFGPVAGLADWFIENLGPILWEVQTPFVKSRGFDASPNQNADILARLKDISEQSGALPEADYFIEALEEESDSELEKRAGWDHRHRLGHGCSDLALPRICIIPEEHSVVLIVDGLPKAQGAPIVFLSPDKNPRRRTFHVVPKNVFSSAVADFVNQTLVRARTNGRFTKWASWLTERWHQANALAESPEQRLKWMVGEVSAKKIRQLDKVRPNVAMSMERLLLDCRTVEHASELDPIEQLVNDYIVKGKSTTSSSREVNWRGFARNAVRLDQPDFQQGYQLAQLTRDRLKLGVHPIREPEEILNRFGVLIGDACDSPLFRVAVCGSNSALAHIVPSSHAPRMKTNSAHRFAVLSGLGRLLWEGRRGQGQPIARAQGDYSMLTESRRANAFAAELLLPREVIQGMDPMSPAIMNMADSYGISPSAARWHLYNANSGEYGQ